MYEKGPDRTGRRKDEFYQFKAPVCINAIFGEKFNSLAKLGYAG